METSVYFTITLTQWMNHSCAFSQQGEKGGG